MSDEDPSPKNYTAHRRNLIIASSFTLLLAFTGIDIRNITLFGVSLQTIDPYKIYIILIIWLGYAMLRYAQSWIMAYSDDFSDELIKAMPITSLKMVQAAAKKTYEIAPKHEKAGEEWKFVRLASPTFEKTREQPGCIRVRGTAQLNLKLKEGTSATGYNVDFTLGPWPSWRAQIKAALYCALLRPAFLEYFFPFVMWFAAFASTACLLIKQYRA
jgi:hypothetical protein